MSKILNLYAHSNETLNDAVNRVVVEIYLKRQKEGLQSIVLCGSEPGVGTTTVSINLALSLAQAHWKTLLVDGDLRKNTNYKHLSEDFEKGMKEYLEGSAECKDVIYGSSQDNLFFLPSGQQAENPVSLLCSERLNQLLEELEDKFDFIIIDSPSLNASQDTCVMASKVQGTVLVSAFNQSRTPLLKKSKTCLEDTGAKVLGVIVNKVDNIAYRDYLKDYDYFRKEKYMTNSRKKEPKND